MRNIVATNLIVTESALFIGICGVEGLLTLTDRVLSLQHEPPSSSFFLVVVDRHTRNPLLFLLFIYESAPSTWLIINTKKLWIHFNL